MPVMAHIPRPPCAPVRPAPCCAWRSSPSWPAGTACAQGRGRRHRQHFCGKHGLMMKQLATGFAGSHSPRSRRRGLWSFRSSSSPGGGREVPDQAASASGSRFPRHHAIVIDRNANFSHSPKPPFPSQRFDLVVDSGGGGFSTCEAVGARVWRIE